MRFILHPSSPTALLMVSSVFRLNESEPRNGSDLQHGKRTRAGLLPSLCIEFVYRSDSILKQPILCRSNPTKVELLLRPVQMPETDLITRHNETPEGISIPQIHQIDRVKVGSGIQLASLKFLLLETELNWQSDPLRSDFMLQRSQTGFPKM